MVNIKKVYFADIIEKSYYNWEKGDTIILNGGTGTGKSHFIVNELSNYVATRNRKILYLTNRTKLKEKISKEIEEKNITNIKVMNYQEFQKLIINDIPILDYSYIVCDEAHYLFTDARFNRETYFAYEYLMNNKKSIIIYMSATAYNLFAYLKSKGKVKPEHEYAIPINYNYVDKLVFYRKKDVITIINNILTTTDDKIIYFCNSSKRIKELYELYKDNSCVICSKNNRKLIDIANLDSIQEFDDSTITFNKRILFATPAIDNGIDIKDKQVKHIISDIIDRDTTQQCFGRKRILDDNDTCTFYLRKYTKSNLVYFRNSIESNLEDTNLFVGDKEAWKQKHKRNLYFHNSCIWHNEIIEKALLNDCVYFKHAIDFYTYTDMMKVGYDNYMINILGDSIKNIEYMEVTQAKNNKVVLEKYLDSIVEKVLLKEQQQELKEEFNKAELKDRTMGINSLNEILADKSLPYVIESSRSSKRINGKVKSFTYWIVKRIVL